MRHIVLATFLLGISLKMYAPEANVDTSSNMRNTNTDQVIQIPEVDPVGQLSESVEVVEAANYSCFLHNIEDLHLNERQHAIVYRDSWRLKAYRFFACYSVIYGIYSYAFKDRLDSDYNEYYSLLSFLGLAMLFFDCGMEGVKPLRRSFC